MELFSQIVFPILGIVMILTALGAFFLPYGIKLKEATQKIAAFGVNLDISVVTAIMLGGMIFCGMGFYLNERSYKKDWQELKQQVDQQKNDLAKFQTMIDTKDEQITFFSKQNITYHFVLDDLASNEAPPSPQSLKCILYKNFKDRSDSSVYSVFSTANGYKVTFLNISGDQFTDQAPVVFLYDKETHKRWGSNSFNPAAPTISLSATGTR